MWVVAVTKRVIVVGADRPVRHMLEIYRTTDGIHHEQTHAGLASRPGHQCVCSTSHCTGPGAARSHGCYERAGAEKQSLCTRLPGARTSRHQLRRRFIRVMFVSLIEL